MDGLIDGQMDGTLHTGLMGKWRASQSHVNDEHRSAFPNRGAHTLAFCRSDQS